MSDNSVGSSGTDVMDDACEISEAGEGESGLVEADKRCSRSCSTAPLLVGES